MHWACDGQGSLWQLGTLCPGTVEDVPPHVCGGSRRLRHSCPSPAARCPGGQRLPLLWSCVTWWREPEARMQRAWGCGKGEVQELHLQGAQVSRGDTGQAEGVTTGQEGKRAMPWMCWRA